MRWAYPIVASAGLSLILGGCPQDVGVGPQDGDGGQVQSLADFFRRECGRGRTVRSVPTATFVKTRYRMESTVTPEDSALGRALRLASGTFDSEDFVGQGFRTLLEVDASGVVQYSVLLRDVGDRKTYTRQPYGLSAKFVVENGCLWLQVERDETEFDPTQYEGGPCGVNKITLTRRGPVASVQPGEEYICVSFTVESSCHECWFAADTWHERIQYAIIYEAEGSLDGVGVVAWTPPGANGQSADGLSGQPQTVNVRAGERVKVSGTTEITYQRSPSPEELGYEEQR